jgi:hypothetical protein
MNKIKNQSGVEIICVGSKGSHIRNRNVYNLTITKLINLINKNWALGGLARHTEHNELIFICEDDNIPVEEIQRLIASANFYSDLNKDYSIK